MSSIVYHTRGIVLDSYNVGEADRILVVFTEDFGMLRLFAQGIRYQKSKLAAHAVLFSFSRVSFVLGRDIFRLVDAEVEKRFSFSECPFMAAGRVSRFLARIIQGQESDHAVWRLLVSAFHFLAYESENADKKREDAAYDFFNLLFSVRLLSRLGYAGELEGDIRALLARDDWDGAAFQYKKMLEDVFHKGIHASQL